MGSFNKRLNVNEEILSKTQRIIRVVITFGLIVYGSVIVNHSFYSFWLSYGPPNDYPEAWYQIGLIYFWRGIGLITAGIYFQFLWSRIRSSKIVKIWSGIVFIGLFYPYVREFLLIDTCLDEGGAWVDIYFRCES